MTLGTFYVIFQFLMFPVLFAGIIQGSINQKHSQRDRVLTVVQASCIVLGLAGLITIWLMIGPLSLLLAIVAEGILWWLGEKVAQINIDKKRTSKGERPADENVVL